MVRRSLCHQIFLVDEVAGRVLRRRCSSCSSCFIAKWATNCFMFIAFSSSLELRISDSNFPLRNRRTKYNCHLNTNLQYYTVMVLPAKVRAILRISKCTRGSKCYWLRENAVIEDSNLFMGFLRNAFLFSLYRYLISLCSDWQDKILYCLLITWFFYQTWEWIYISFYLTTIIA